MAILKESSGGTGLQLENLPPPGQYMGVCIKIVDLFGVEREKFQSQEKELRDVTRFIFGLKDAAGNKFLVQTFEFRISGAPGSNLMEFLSGWLGEAPKYGWDYCEMLGRGAMVSVQHKASRSNPAKVYADIANISPVFPQLASQVPAKAEFDSILLAAERAPNTNQPQQTHPAFPAHMAAPAPAPIPTPAAMISPTVTFPPPGWTQHPQNPSYYYKGQEVLTADQLRAKYAAPAPAPAAAVPPPPANVPLTGEVPF
jgi:hypothetical protein